MRATFCQQWVAGSPSYSGGGIANTHSHKSPSSLLSGYQLSEFSLGDCGRESGELRESGQENSKLGESCGDSDRESCGDGGD